jgi:DNA repair exonuclease SbcCD ATPase subunit
MTSNGIMAEIRSLLSQGRSSGQVIALGYKPPTVYKVQHQLHSPSQGKGAVSTPGGIQPLSGNVDHKPRAQLEAENISLRREIETLKSHLEYVLGEDAELEAKVKTSEERAKALVSKAATAGQLRQKAEVQAHALGQDNQKLRGKLAQWQLWGKNAHVAIQSLTAEVAVLRSLAVWAGHPCTVCNQPTSGLVDRETAARLLKNFGHKACVEK